VELPARQAKEAARPETWAAQRSVQATSGEPLALERPCREKASSQ
jgi:hypothetical protein